MIKIKKLQPSDNLAEVSSIYAKSWKAAYKGILPQDYLDNIPEDRWVKALENPERHILVMLKDENIIGTSSYGKSRNAEYEGLGEIYSIYLLPEHMGKGYGKKLINAVIGELNKLGYKNIFLWVLEDNTRAIRFYENMGLAKTKNTRELKIGGKSVREIRYMVKIQE